VIVLIERDVYLNTLRPFMDTDLIKVLTGLRRSGKSTLLQLVQKDLLGRGVSEHQFLSINFESLDRANASLMDIHHEILTFGKGHAGRTYLFLDEIQELDGWERMVNSLRVDLDCDLYVTGSNSKLLSGELATYLSGRYVEIPVYPFSFREIVSVETSRHPDRKVEDLFQSYLRLGGMPFVYENDLDPSAAMTYLHDLYASILLKDIVTRYAIRDIDLFGRLMAYLLANVGCSFSGSNVTDFLKNEKRTLSQETVYNYIAYAKEACLLHLVQREDVQGKRLLKFQEKIFLADHGIREAVYGNNQRDINQILENIVHQELLRRGYRVRIGKSGTKEIDFVADRLQQRRYFQVSYLLAEASVIEREFSAFSGIPDHYPKYVLSLDRFDFSRNGIVHRNLIDFLLEEDV
jgi:predicted AAA+ superfamily ATPase